MGLSFLHLLTGGAPYEELMENVHCPLLLRNKLRNIWLKGDENDPYYVIYQVVDSLVDHSISISTDCQDDAVLCDTLYRYVVLLGGSSALRTGLIENELYVNNPVWSAVVHCLGLIPEPSRVSPVITVKRRANSRANIAANQECIDTYLRDVDEWSINSGKNFRMQQVRNNLKRLGEGTEQLLYELLHMNPSQRYYLPHQLIYF